MRLMTCLQTNVGLPNGGNHIGVECATYGNQVQAMRALHVRQERGDQNGFELWWWWESTANQFKRIQVGSLGMGRLG